MDGDGVTDKGMAVLPPGWTLVTLGELVELNPRRWDNYPADEELVSFVPMAAVEAETGKLDATTTRPWVEVKRGYTTFQDGDVLFAKITPCMENGKFALAQGLHNGRGAGSTEYHVLRSTSAVMPKLLLHYLLQQSFRDDARAKMQGAAGQLRVPANFLADAPFPLAPLPEQHRIVVAIEEQFTRLDAAGAALERARANLKRYRAAVLTSACTGRLVPTEAALARAEGRDYETGEQLLARVLEEEGSGHRHDPQSFTVKPNDSYRLPEGWVNTRLGCLTEVVTSESRGWASYYSDNGALFIRAQDIKTDSLRLESAAHVSLSGVTEGRRTRVRQWDLLVTITGANVTKTALVRQPTPEAYVSQHVGLVRLLSPTLAPYVFLWIIDPANGRAILERDAYGAGKPGLNLDNLRELSIAVPPLAEQHRIVAEVERRLSVLDEMEAAIASDLKRAERLRQAVLRRAFAGQLVPQDPTDEPASLLLERIRAARATNGTGHKAGNGTGKRRRRARATAQIPLLED